jgi:hypothetical protein
MLKIATAVLALSLTGCVVETGVRYVDNRTAIISSRGNGFTTPKQVQQNVMREAAKLTLSRGYTHFSILDSRDASSTGAYQMPGTSTTQGAFNARSTYNGGVQGTYSQQTTTTPGAVVPIFFPGMDVAVRMYKAPDVPDGAFVAAEFVKPKS